jgi:hypothetical protein
VLRRVVVPVTATIAAAALTAGVVALVQPDRFEERSEAASRLRVAVQQLSTLGSTRDRLERVQDTLPPVPFQPRILSATPGSYQGRPNESPLDVTLDPKGRPYDVALRPGMTLTRERLATLHAPSRRVRFGDGAFVSRVGSEADEPLLLRPRAGNDYPVDVVWLAEPGVALTRGATGVVIVEGDSPVARWAALPRLAYGTDTGTGAITTEEWADRSRQLPSPNVLDRLFEKKLIDGRADHVVADIDGVPGTDTIVFSNGFGDGGFPLVAGYDASGRRVALVIWHVKAPWRLAFPHGTPPRQVTEREAELAKCLRGGWVTSDAYDRCRVVGR